MMGERDWLTLLVLFFSLTQITGKLWCDVTKTCVSQPYVRCTIGQDMPPYEMALSCNSRPGPPHSFNSSITSVHKGQNDSYLMTFSWKGPSDDSKTAIQGYGIEIGSKAIPSPFKSYYIDLRGNENIFRNKSLFVDVLDLSYFLNCHYTGVLRETLSIDIAITSYPMFCSDSLSTNSIFGKINLTRQGGYTESELVSITENVTPEAEQESLIDTDSYKTVIATVVIAGAVVISVLVTLFFFSRKYDLRTCKKIFRTKETFESERLNESEQATNNDNRLNGNNNGEIHRNLNDGHKPGIDNDDSNGWSNSNAKHQTPGDFISLPNEHLRTAEYAQTYQVIKPYCHIHTCGYKSPMSPETWPPEHQQYPSIADDVGKNAQNSHGILNVPENSYHHGGSIGFLPPCDSSTESLDSIAIMRGLEQINFEH